MATRSVCRLLGVTFAIFSVAVVVRFALPASITTVHIPQPAYWPTAAWRESSPEKQGVDSTKLAEALDTIRRKHWHIHSILVIRNGFVILDANFFPYDSTTPHDIASCTKSITATLIGTAIQDRKVKSVADPVLSYFTDRVPKNADGRKQRITIADMLSMRSGMECEYKGEATLQEMRASADWTQFMLDRPMNQEPGKDFVYCSGSAHLLAALISHATGEALINFARDRLFGRLGISDVIWPTDPQGVNRGWGDLHLRPRDLAKIGVLYLHDGVWDGKRILPTEFVEASTTPVTKTPFGDDYYGLGWWVSPTERQNEFMAIGRGGQRLTVLRKYNAIIVVTGGGEFDPGDVNALLARAVVSDQVLPENSDGLSSLKAETEIIAQNPDRTPDPIKVPERSQRISGRVYNLSPNALGLSAFSIDFAPEQPVVTFSFQDSRTERHPIGIGTSVVSGEGYLGLPVACRGNWEQDGTLTFEYDSIANINAYVFHIIPQEFGVSIEVRERGGTIKTTLDGRPTPPN